MTEVRAASENNPWLMKNAGQYKFPKAIPDTDLRRFTLVFGLYSFNPCSSVESVVNEDNRVHDISRPGNQDAAQLALQLSRIFCKSALFMQNKANFRKAEMDVSLFATRDYERISACAFRKAKPIKPNFQGGRQMDANLFVEKGVRKLLLRCNPQKNSI